MRGRKNLKTNANQNNKPTINNNNIIINISKGSSFNVDELERKGAILANSMPPTIKEGSREDDQAEGASHGARTTGGLGFRNDNSVSLQPREVRAFRKAFLRKQSNEGQSAGVTISGGGSIRQSRVAAGPPSQGTSVPRVGGVSGPGVSGGQTKQVKPRVPLRLPDDPDFEPSFLPRIKEKKKKKLLDGVSKGGAELETLDDASLPNPFSDPEKQHTPIAAAVTLEGNSSKQRSVLRGRKSTLEQEDRLQLHAAENKQPGPTEEEKVVYMVPQKQRQ